MDDKVLRAAMKTAADGQQVELTRLLAERDQLAAWSSMHAPEPAKRAIADQLANIDQRVVELLVTFHRAGGRIALEPPTAMGVESVVTETRVVTKMPATEAEMTAAAPTEVAPTEAASTERVPAPERAASPPVVPPARPNAPTATPRRPVEPSRVAPRAASNRPEDSGEFSVPTRPRSLRPEAPAASRQDLERLRSAASSGELHAQAPAPAIWRPAFARQLAHLGPGVDLNAERDRVVAAGKGCDAWKGWPRHVQKHLVGHVACRLRALQDEHGVSDVELQDAFSALTRFSKREQPGFVFGLSRNHTPQHGPSWDDDAERHWDQLTGLLPDGPEETPNQEKCLEKLGFLIPEIEAAPNDEVRGLVTDQAVRAVAAALDAGVDSRDRRLVRLASGLASQLEGRLFRRLRRAIRDAESPDEDEDDVVAAIPEDWGWWKWTRGKRGVIVGGSPREHARKRLEAAFGFEALEWVGAENAKRGLQSLRNRVASGNVHTLLMLGRFIGHDADDILLPAAREAGTAWVHVDHGYGVNRVRSAIERFLEPEGEPSL